MRRVPLGEGFGDETFALFVGPAPGSRLPAPGSGLAEGSTTHEVWFAIALDRVWYLRPVGYADGMTDDEARARLFRHHMWEQRLAAARAEKEASCPTKS